MIRLLRELERRLKAKGLPEKEAWDLLALASGLSRKDLLLGLSRTPPPGTEARALALLEKRLGGYPLQYLLGEVEFFGLPVLSAGVVNPPEDGYEVIARRVDGGDYRKVVLQGDVLVGMLVAGRVERAGILTSLIQERANVRRVKSFLLEEAFGHIHLPRSVRQERIKETAAGIMKAGAARDEGV